MLLDQTGFSKYNWNFPTGQSLDGGNLVKHHVWWKKGVKSEPSLNKCLAVNMLSFSIWNVLCWSEALQESWAWVLVASPSENKSKTGGNFSNCTAYWGDGFMRNIKKVSRQAQRLISLRKPDFAKRKKNICGSFAGSRLTIRAVATGHAKLGRGLQDQ